MKFTFDRVYELRNGRRCMLNVFKFAGRESQRILVDNDTNECIAYEKDYVGNCCKRYLVAPHDLDIVRIYSDWSCDLCLWDEEDTYILNKIERNYLANVIRPFRDRIKSIAKCECGNYYEHHYYEYIEIKYKDRPGIDNGMHFPTFMKGTMYKGMKSGHEYPLNELKL